MNWKYLTHTTKTSKVLTLNFFRMNLFFNIILIADHEITIFLCMNNTILIQKYIFYNLFLGTFFHKLTMYLNNLINVKQ